MINPCLVDKEIIEDLCKLSKKIFGSKWKWRKLANRRGARPEQMLESMTKTIKSLEEINERLRAQNTNSKNETKEGTSGQEVRSGETELQSDTNGGT